MDNVNQTILKNSYKNAQMALLSLEEVIPMTNGDLCNELKRQYEGYQSHVNQIAKTAHLKSISLPDVGAMAKTMLWASINLKTVTDDSAGHIAEMVLKGTVTGLTALIKDLSEYGKELDVEVLTVLDALKDFEEDCEKRLKELL